MLCAFPLSLSPDHSGRVKKGRITVSHGISIYYVTSGIKAFLSLSVEFSHVGKHLLDIWFEPVAPPLIVSTGERERTLLPFTQTVQEWQSTPIGVLLPSTDLIVPIRLSSQSLI